MLDYVDLAQRSNSSACGQVDVHIFSSCVLRPASCVPNCEYQSLTLRVKITFFVPVPSCVLRPASCVSIRTILPRTSSLSSVPALDRDAPVRRFSLHSTLVPIRDAGRRTQDAGRPLVKKPTSTQLRIRDAGRRTQDAGRGLVRNVTFPRLKFHEIGNGSSGKQMLRMQEK